GWGRKFFFFFFWGVIKGAGEGFLKKYKKSVWVFWGGGWCWVAGGRVGWGVCGCCCGVGCWGVVVGRGGGGFCGFVGWVGCCLGGVVGFGCVWCGVRVVCVCCSFCSVLSSMWVLRIP
ncbi:hypothetical protein RA274_27710, partial [Pseudomonas syringae pv. tagetis]|uniref:hypothetical protein n=1 Tax=Pseudomonas syringae group genomosp. 7 TaxID=251699 RepID=UPI0037704FB0